MWTLEREAGPGRRARGAPRPGEGGSARAGALDGVTLVSASPGLVDAVAPAVAAAGLDEVRVLEPARSAECGSGSVLWDATVQGVPPAGAVLVGLHDDAVWGRAAALPSHRAVVLPQGAAWLTRHLTGARGGSPARVVAVAGAGEMACPDRVAVLVARAACWAGLSTVVVDAHGAGSIAAAMAGARTGAGHRPRAGWVEAAESVRDGSSGGLTATLPELSGAAVLSGSVREVPDPQRGGVVSALRAESDLVVVSLGAVGPDDWLDTPEILMPLGGDEERLLAVSEGPWPQRRSGTSGRGTPSVVTVRTGSSAPDGPEAAAALGGAWAGTVDVRTLRIARGTRRLLKRSWAPRLAAGRPLGEAS